MKYKIPKIILNPQRETSVHRGHSWIFSRAIKKKEDDQLEKGSFVQVLSSSGEHLCFGHYEAGTIAIKVLGKKSVAQDRSESEIIKEYILYAIEMRKLLGLINSKETNAFRLINGEGDFLPGLIVDIYGETAVVQAQTAGMYRLRRLIANLLMESMNEHKLKGVYDRSKLLDSDSKVEEYSYLNGESGSSIVNENKIKFDVDWVSGQKTGFFIDQRDNRKLLGEYSKNKHVCNAFCYTGGFSVYATHGGASFVLSIDASESALVGVDKNFRLNNFNENHEELKGDCFNILDNLPRQFDILVVDPPAFIKHRSGREQGIKGYMTVNFQAFKHLKPGGILFTFSCSQLLSRQEFYEMLQRAALRANKDIQILHTLSQAACHPIRLSHPESDYLKGYVLKVV